MGLLLDTGVAPVAGGGGGVPLLLPTDLVGTSSYDAGTRILTVQDGGIVQIGDAQTFPVRLRARVRWTSTLGNGYVYFCFATTLSPEFVGLGARLRSSGTHGLTRQTGTLAAPSASNVGSGGSMLPTPVGGTWIRLDSTSIPYLSDGRHKALSVVYTEGDAGGAIDFDVSPAWLEGDWTSDADPAPTATLCVHNDSGEDFDIDLGALYVDLFEEGR